MINSDPAATTRVAKGSTVTLDVAQTPGVDVPDVRGKSEDEAVNILRFVGLQPTPTPQANDTVPKDQAVGTDPAAGTRVQRGAVVRLFISSGPSEVDVPNTIGQTQGAATAALTNASFSVIVNFTPAPGSRWHRRLPEPDRWEIDQGRNGHDHRRPVDPWRGPHRCGRGTRTTAGTTCRGGGRRTAGPCSCPR